MFLLISLFTSAKIWRLFLFIKQILFIFVSKKSINMTIQQLEYIVAVDKYRHFVKAAEACNITQSTLSSMIQKLEDELDIVIFDRKRHPVGVTEVGAKVISHARTVLSDTERIKEMILTEQQKETGEIKMGVIPTVAPYILPKLFNLLKKNYPGLHLRASEDMTSTLVSKLECAEIDMALMATPIGNKNLLEIPIYYEKFLAYVSSGEEIYEEEEIDASKMPTEHLWVLQEGHCLRNQVLDICGSKSAYSAIYEAGSIDTLIRIVDTNGGYTIIPELHKDFLSPSQASRLRKIVKPEPVREISLVIRADYVKERFLNIISDSIRKIIPEQMIDPRLKKFAIRL